MITIDGKNGTGFMIWEERWFWDRSFYYDDWGGPQNCSVNICFNLRSALFAINQANNLGVKVVRDDCVFINAEILKTTIPATHGF